MRFIVCVISAGEYSCLKVDLLFKREFSYYLIQIYIPCCMLVIVSWVSFWLDANAVPARVSLGVTTLLTMATQTTGINNSLPPVSYTKVSAVPHRRPPTAADICASSAQPPDRPSTCGPACA